MTACIYLTKQQREHIYERLPAELAGITQPAATQTVALMKKEGILLVVAGGEDRRQRVVRLSPQGEQLGVCHVGGINSDGLSRAALLGYDRHRLVEFTRQLLSRGFIDRNIFWYDERGPERDPDERPAEQVDPAKPVWSIVMGWNDFTFGTQGDRGRTPLRVGIVLISRANRKDQDKTALFDQRNRVFDGGGRRAGPVHRKSAAGANKPAADRIIEEFFFGHLMQGARQNRVANP
nr:hypothetical protein [Massilia sp. CCM 8734]